MAEVPKASMDNEESPSNNAANEDGNRQVLAPSEGPREELINTAIKFLQNPKVMGSPLHQKKAFLTKKGLTQEEISLAVERSGVTEAAAGPNHVDTNQTRPPPPGYHPGMMTPYNQIHPPIPPQSRWAQMRDLTLASVVVAGVSYAVYRLFKTYIEPLIIGKNAQENRLDRLELQVEEIHKSVNGSLSEISRTLAAIQLTINNQSQQPATSQVVGRGITDLKADISSLRSLLLSKNQFPAPPTTAPMLPSWQLAGASSGGAQQNNSPNTSPPATPASTPSTSITPKKEEMSASTGNTDEDEELAGTSSIATNRTEADDNENQEIQEDSADTNTKEAQAN